MSGYGVPQGPTPGSPRSGRSTPALPVLELVGLGLAALAFIVAFLPWAKADVPEGVDVDATASGWELALPTAITVLLLVAALLTAAPLFAKRAATEDGNASPVPAMLAVLAAVLAIVYVVIGGSYLGTDLSRGIGTWLGLLLALGAAAALELSWLQRTGKVKKAPAAGPSNWNTGGGQSYGQPQQQPYQQQYPAQQPPAPSYGQQPSYGAQGGYPGPATGGQPAQQPAPYGGQEPYPPQSGGYPSQGGYHPQG